MGSEHNVKSLYVEQLPFEQPHKALGGEKSCTINNCISTLSRSLTAPPCPGDRHSPSHRSELRALRELITSGQGQARSVIHHLKLPHVETSAHTPVPVLVSAMEGRQVAWPPEEITPNRTLRRSHLSLAGTLQLNETGGLLRAGVTIPSCSQSYR